MTRTFVAAALTTAALLLSGCTADQLSAGAAPGETSSPPAATGTPQRPQTGSATPDDSGTVLDVAAADDLSTFVAAVNAAGLEQTLALPGPLTVFAPTNEAFEALPDGLLEELLKPENKGTLTLVVAYHVVEDEITSADLDGEVTALSGQSLELSSSSGGSVNEAAIVSADAEASNGVVHAIDRVLIPPDVDPEALLAPAE